MAIDDLKWYTDHHVLPRTRSEWKPRFEGACNYLFGDVSKVLSNWNLRRFTNDFVLQNFICVLITDSGALIRAKYISHDANLAGNQILIGFKYEINYIDLEDITGTHIVKMVLLDEDGAEKMWRKLDIDMDQVRNTQGNVALNINLTLEW